MCTYRHVQQHCTARHETKQKLCGLAYKGACKLHGRAAKVEYDEGGYALSNAYNMHRVLYNMCEQLLARCLEKGGAAMLQHPFDESSVVQKRHVWLIHSTFVMT